MARTYRKRGGGGGSSAGGASQQSKKTYAKKSGGGAPWDNPLIEQNRLARLLRRGGIGGAMGAELSPLTPEEMVMRDLEGTTMAEPGIPDLASMDENQFRDYIASIDQENIPGASPADEGWAQAELGSMADINPPIGQMEKNVLQPTPIPTSKPGGWGGTIDESKRGMKAETPPVVSEYREFSCRAVPYESI